MQKHLPVMLDALTLIRKKLPVIQAKMILPTEELKELAGRLPALHSNIEIQIGDLPGALTAADLAIASTAREVFSRWGARGVVGAVAGAG